MIITETGALWAKGGVHPLSWTAPDALAENVEDESFDPDAPVTFKSAWERYLTPTAAAAVLHDST